MNEGYADSSRLDLGVSSAASGDLAAIARGGLLNLVGVISNAGFGFALVVIVTRGLGGTATGIFFESIALFNILGTLAQWGADIGVVRTIPRYRVEGRLPDVANAIRAGVVPAIVLGSALAVATLLFAPQLGRLLTNGAHGPELAPVLRVLAPFLPVYAAYMIGLAVTRGFGTMLPSTAVDKFGRAVAQPLLVGLCLWLGLSARSLALAWAAPFAAGLAMILVWSFALLKRSRAVATDLVGPPSGLRDVLIEFWRFTAPRGLAGVFAVVVLWLDTLLVGALRSASAAGAYAAATRFLTFGQFIGVAISQVVAPKLSELLASGDRTRARTVYATATWWLMAVSWPLYVSMIVLAPSLLSIFGPGFQRAEGVLVILGLAMLVATAVGPVDVVLLMAGRSSWNLVNTAVAVAVNVGLNLLLIPRLGLVGAAIAWAASILVNNLLPLIEVWSLVRLQPFGTGSIVTALSAVGWFGIVGLVARVFLGNGMGSIVVTALVASAGHALTLWRVRGPLRLEAFRAGGSRMVRSKRGLDR